MTIFQKIIEQRSTNGDRLIRDYLGSRSGKATSVTGYSSLRHSAVFGCISLISDGVSTLPIDAYKKVKDRRIEVPLPKVIASPSVWMSDVDWRRQILVSWLMEGNAYGQIVSRDIFQRPAQIELLDPFSVSVRENPTTYELEYSVRGKKVDSDSIVHWPGLLLPGERVGVSPITYAAAQVGMGLNAQHYAQQYFTDGVKANGVISMPGIEKGSAEQARELKERFVESAQRAHEPVVLFGETKYTPLNISAADTQFLESSNASGQDIARFFSVMPENIGIETGSSRTYTNMESRAMHILKYTFNPWIVRLEKALSTLTNPTTYIKCNRDAALSVDTMTRYNANQIGIRTGFLTVNEVRELEDRPPVEGGDITLWPPASAGKTGQDQPLGKK